MCVVKIVYNDIHWLHQDPRGHPENPYRIEIILDVLKKKKLYDKLEFSSIDRDDNSILLVHDKNYVEWIREESRKGFHYIDSDTYVSRNTYRVAKIFSAVTRHVAIEAVEKKGIWVILSRPPGHHAGVNGRALGAPTLGFCIFNHIAVAAKGVLESNNKVLIIDIDGHHGNGTQEIFWNESRVIHVDLHEHGIYPGTGWVSDMGGLNAYGSKINIPLQPYTGDNVYYWVLQKIILPLIDKYRIKTILVSLGLDSYVEDPLTALGASKDMFYLYGYILHELFEENIIRAIIVVLEGGYDAGLREGFPSFIKGLLGLRKKIEVKPKTPSKKIYSVLKNIMEEYHEIEI